MKNKKLLIWMITSFFCCMCLNLYASDSVIYSGSTKDREDLKSFIFIGDTQRASNWEIGREKNDEVRPLILKQIAAENPAFIVHLGDFVFMGSDEDEWNAFDNFALNIRKKSIPVFPTLGNHEYFGNNEKAFKNYFSRFPHINNAKWYSFKFCNIGFIILNSNFDELKEKEQAKQNDWYLKKLEDLQNDSSITSIIIACHHSPYTNSTIVSADEDVQKYFVEPMFDIPKAKLFFTGHCHSYEHFEKNGKHFIVTGGGSGPRQKLRTKPIYQDTFEGERIRNFHYCKVTIKDEGLLVQMIYIDDNILRQAQDDNKQAQDDNKWKVGQEFLVGYEKD
ncbi:MAG: metallophosphoesterase [bacterium]